MPYIERKGVIKGSQDNLIVFIKAIDESLMDDFYEIPLKGDRLKMVIFNWSGISKTTWKRYK